MKKNETGNSNKWISFRVKETEYKIIYNHFEQSCHRKLSEYARNVLLHKPVVIKYRMVSADLLLDEIIAIKKDLHGFGNNFNQAVKKLHTLSQYADIKHWLAIHEHRQTQCLSLVNQLLQSVNKLHEQWSSE